MEASQNKRDAANRICNRDFVLAVDTCFISKCNRFEVISDFHSLTNGGNQFPVRGSIAEQK
jgi:hypothetical protein